MEEEEEEEEVGCVLSKNKNPTLRMWGKTPGSSKRTPGSFRRTPEPFQMTPEPI